MLACRQWCFLSFCMHQQVTMPSGSVQVASRLGFGASCTVPCMKGALLCGILHSTKAECCCYKLHQTVSTKSRAGWHPALYAAHAEQALQSHVLQATLRLVAVRSATPVHVQLHLLALCQATAHRHLPLGGQAAGQPQALTWLHCPLCVPASASPAVVASSPQLQSPACVTTCMGPCRTAVQVTQCAADPSHWYAACETLHAMLAAAEC